MSLRIQMDHGEWFVKKKLVVNLKKSKMMGMFQSLKHNAIWKEFAKLFLISHGEPLLCCFADTGHCTFHLLVKPGTFIGSVHF